MTSLSQSYFVGINFSTFKQAFLATYPVFPDFKEEVKTINNTISSGRLNLNWTTAIGIMSEEIQMSLVQLLEDMTSRQVFKTKT